MRWIRTNVCECSMAFFTQEKFYGPASVECFFYLPLMPCFLIKNLLLIFYIFIYIFWLLSLFVITVISICIEWYRFSKLKFVKIIMLIYHEDQIASWLAYNCKLYYYIFCEIYVNQYSYIKVLKTIIQSANIDEWVC